MLSSFERRVCDLFPTIPRPAITWNGYGPELRRPTRFIWDFADIFSRVSPPANVTQLRTRYPRLQMAPTRLMDEREMNAVLQLRSGGMGHSFPRRELRRTRPGTVVTLDPVIAVSWPEPRRFYPCSSVRFRSFLRPNSRTGHCLCRTRASSGADHEAMDDRQWTRTTRSA